MPQEQIAEIVSPEGSEKMTQGAISYRVARAIDRLRYILWLDSLDLTGEIVERVMLEAFRVADIRANVTRRVRAIKALWATGTTYGHAGIASVTVQTALDLARFWAAGVPDGDDDVNRVAAWIRGYRPKMLREQRAGIQRRERLRAALRRRKEAE